MLEDFNKIILVQTVKFYFSHIFPVCYQSTRLDKTERVLCAPSCPDPGRLKTPKRANFINSNQKAHMGTRQWEITKNLDKAWFNSFQIQNLLLESPAAFEVFDNLLSEILPVSRKIATPLGNNIFLVIQILTTIQNSSYIIQKRTWLFWKVMICLQDIVLKNQMKTKQRQEFVIESSQILIRYIHNL